MKTRAQIYGQEAAGILRDITLYRALAEEQLVRLYPGKEEKVRKILEHLVRQGRIIRNNDGLYCSDQDAAENLDHGLLSAVWVLVDLIDQVEFHTAGDYPAKIFFFSDGEVYEIVHAAYGQEALLCHLLSAKTEEPPNYIVLVDDPQQINFLDIFNVKGYCTVSPTGEVQYYQKE